VSSMMGCQLRLALAFGLGRGAHLGFVALRVWGRELLGFAGCGLGATCRGSLVKDRWPAWGTPRVGFGVQLESLILAQNERWRQA
jgi:hypothetical protein